MHLQVEIECPQCGGEIAFPVIRKLVWGIDGYNYGVNIQGFWVGQDMHIITI